MALSMQAKIITVNTADNTDFSAGKTNLVTAINALADGDTIQFNISGSGVHRLEADGACWARRKCGRRESNPHEPKLAGF